MLEKASKYLVLTSCSLLLTSHLVSHVQQYLQFSTSVHIEILEKGGKNAVPAVSVCRVVDVIPESAILEECPELKKERGYRFQNMFQSCMSNLKRKWPFEKWFQLSPKEVGFGVDRGFSAADVIRCSSPVQSLREGFECLSLLSDLADVNCSRDNVYSRGLYRQPRQTLLQSKSTSFDTASGAVGVGHVLIRPEFGLRHSIYKSVVFLNVHGSLELPQFDLFGNTWQRLAIRPKRLYELYFGHYRIERLEPPFETDCKNYHQLGHAQSAKSNSDHAHSADSQGHAQSADSLGHAHSTQFQSADFLSHAPSQAYCYDTCLRRHLTTANCSYFDKFPIVREVDGQLRWCGPFDWEFLESVEVDCRGRCRNECHQDVFEYDLIDLTETEWVFDEDPAWNNQFAEIAVNAKLSHQMVYKHYAAMTVTDFLSGIGGLFSLWLGTSIITVYDLAVAFYKRFRMIKERPFKKVNGLKPSRKPTKLRKT